MRWTVPARDRGGKFPALCLCDAGLKDAGIEVVAGGVRMPRTNALVERWVQACRRELPDRTSVWSRGRLFHVLREFAHVCRGHRPRQGIADARPWYPLPAPIADTAGTARPAVRRRDRLGGILHGHEHAA